MNLLTHTLALQPGQAALLDAILAAPLVSAVALGPVPDEWRKSPKAAGAQGLIEL